MAASLLGTWQKLKIQKGEHQNGSLLLIPTCARNEEECEAQLKVKDEELCRLQQVLRKTIPEDQYERIQQQVAEKDVQLKELYDKLGDLQRCVVPCLRFHVTWCVLFLNVRMPHGASQSALVPRAPLVPRFHSLQALRCTPMGSSNCFA